MSPCEFCDFCSGRFLRDDLTTVSAAKELACDACLEVGEVAAARAEWLADLRADR